MDDTDGFYTPPKAMASLNGSVKPSLNGHTVAPRRKTAARQSPGTVAKAFSAVARILTWYSIITILFQCPATLDECGSASPRICRPYFQLKQAVAPTVTPYYDAYAAPYVELVQPYYDTLDRTVISPTWEYALKYGAPSVIQAQAYSKAQWEKNVQPQLAHYQDIAQARYNQDLAPHIARASEAMTPYLDIARTNALQTYHELLLPGYETVQPYALQGYLLASSYASGTALPALVWVWDTGNGFLNSTVWPQVRALYAEAVEPQLVKIGERLGRYSGKASTLLDTSSSIPTKAGFLSSFLKPTASATTSFANESTASATAADADAEPIMPGADGAAKPVASSEGDVAADVRQKAKEVVAEDLKDWQDRYAKAADEGAAEIEERVEELSQRAIAEEAHATGKALVQALEEAINSGLDELKGDIRANVAASVEGATSAEEAKNELVSAVRRVGLVIKEKAQAVRTWRNTYEQELHSSVLRAAETHFRILDGIRDLALQKIGMKWAWTDGVTYQDWAKYHQLKDRFDEWQGDLEKLIVTHPALESAQMAGNGVEAAAMELASTAAQELGRLKQVALWKLEAGDASDDFDSDSTRLAAEAAVVADAEETAVDPATEAASKIASSVFEPDEATSAADIGSEDASGFVQETLVPSLESLTAEASSTAASVLQEASSAAASVLHSSADAEATPDLASQPSSAILVETPVMAGNTSERTEPDGESPVELPVDDADELNVSLPSSSAPSATASIKPVFMGAAAQSVSDRQPILDDFEEAAEYLQSDLPSSISSVARSAYSQAVAQAAQQYSHALSIVSAQVKGKPKPVHEQMLASVTSAYSQAMASASSRFDDVVSSAQDRFGSTPSPTPVLPSLPTVEWSQIESIAAERLAQGRAWAETQYESAKIAVGLATPTPSTPAEHAERMLQNAQYSYYAGIGLAQARYSEFLAAASSAFSSLTATPTPTDLAGTASSIASVASASAASAASAAGDTVASAASAVSDGASSAASAVSENLSSIAQAGYDTVAGAGASVSDGWDVVVSKISVQVYGAPTPTPWYQSLYDAAGDYAASATAAAAGGASSVTDAASSYASSAAEEAARQYAAVSGLVSELVVGKEPSFSESVYSRLSAAYATAVSSAQSVASAASETIVSAATEATEAVKESMGGKDEL